MMNKDNLVNLNQYNRVFVAVVEEDKQMNHVVEEDKQMDQIVEEDKQMDQFVEETE
jgi:F0F1-type ATP synthase delta subunit